MSTIKTSFRLSVIVLFLVLFTACSTKTSNPHYVKQNKYGFHVVGFNKNIYTLRYTGEPGTSKDEAMNAWLNSAIKICPRSGSNISNITEETSTVYIKPKSLVGSEHDAAIEQTTNMTCLMTGAAGCLLAGFMEVFMKGTVGSGKVEDIPLVEGKIDCNNNE